MYYTSIQMHVTNSRHSGPHNPGLFFSLSKTPETGSAGTGPATPQRQHHIPAFGLSLTFAQWLLQLADPKGGGWQTLRPHILAQINHEEWRGRETDGSTQGSSAGK